MKLAGSKDHYHLLDKLSVRIAFSKCNVALHNFCCYQTINTFTKAENTKLCYQTWHG